MNRFRRIAVLGAGLALIAALLAGVTPAYGAGDGQVSMSRVWVHFQRGQRAAVRAALAQYGARFNYDFSRLDSVVITVPTALLDRIRSSPHVTLVEEDALRYPIADRQSALAALADTTDANGQTIPWGIDAVQARDVWDANRDAVIDDGAPTGAGRTVCIIDTGLYSAHEDFAGVSMDGTAQVDPPWSTDGYGHGTHVAGTIDAANNTLGVVGVSPGQVALYEVKFFNNQGLATYASDLAAAAYDCQDAGANIISMSLGGSGFVDGENAAFADVYAAGILNVAAAGNNGTAGLSYPASYDSVISVAAIDDTDAVANFSQHNSQVELAAPGVSVLSTVPFSDTATLTVGGTTYTGIGIEGAAYGTVGGTVVDGGLCDSAGSWPGEVVLCQRSTETFYSKIINVQNGGGVAMVVYNNVPGNFNATLNGSSTIPAITLSQADGQDVIASHLGESGTVVSTHNVPGSGYAYYDGTSMATPHVSGVAALVWSAHPELTNVQVRSLLDSTALDLGAPGRDAYYGYGLVQAYDALNVPVVTITSPADGSTVPDGDTITFEGAAADLTDGDISADLVWTSNISGEIGTGAGFSTVLPAGTHVITASAANSLGHTGSASITVSVEPPLVVTITGNKLSYSDGKKAKLKILVTDPITGDRVRDATVTLVITGANDQTIVMTGTTSKKGKVKFKTRLYTADLGVGTYTVDVTASAPGYSDGSASTTFDVHQ